MSSQSIVILIMGVTGSGKTLLGQMLAARLNFIFVDADNYHSAENMKKMQIGQPLTDEDRLPWLIDLSRIIDKWLANGQNGILACSALKEEYRRMLIDQPSRTKVLFLKGSYDLIARRLAERKDHFMNPVLLRSQFVTLQEPDNAICLDASLPPDQLLELALKSLK